MDTEILLQNPIYYRYWQIIVLGKKENIPTKSKAYRPQFSKPDFNGSMNHIFKILNDKYGRSSLNQQD